MLFVNLTAAATAAAAEAAENAASFTINPTNFLANLKYMGMGMLGIFIVMGAIILVTLLLNKIFSKKDSGGEE